MSDSLSMSASEEHMARERARGRELRRSQWWRNRRGQGECHYCGRRFPPRELTMDHVVPIARGGKSTKSNVVPCCAECNAGKQSLVPVEWEAHLSRLRARDGEEI